MSSSEIGVNHFACKFFPSPQKVNDGTHLMVWPFWMLWMQLPFIISEELNPLRSSIFFGFGWVLVDLFCFSPVWGACYWALKIFFLILGLEFKIFLRHNNNDPLLLRGEQLSPGIIIKGRSLSWRWVSLLGIIQISSIGGGLIGLKESFLFLLYGFLDHSCNLGYRCTWM